MRNTFDGGGTDASMSLCELGRKCLHSGSDVLDTVGKLCQLTHVH